jgi:hypothetical protein
MSLCAGPPPDPIPLEADQRRQSLLDQGFSHTQAFSWGRRRQTHPLRHQFWVTNPHQDIQFRFWFGSRQGNLRVRLQDSLNRTLFAQSGTTGEVAMTCQVPVGKCTLELDVGHSLGGQAEFGAKGPLVPAVQLDPKRSISCPASPRKGFHWPYLIFLPKVWRHPCLLVVPNNTGFILEQPALLRASGAFEIQQQSALADQLGCPLLVPLFPRPRPNLYLHALTRDSLLTQVPKWRRVDLQLLGMIQDAQERMRARGFAMHSKVLLYGFSAAGSFATRFTLLHPDRVLAVSCGSPGGWPTVPVAAITEKSLNFPVGIADLERLSGRAIDWAALRSVAWFFFLGEKDLNDSVHDRDSFSQADEDFILRTLGPTPVSRWSHAEQMYTSQGLHAEFRLYPSAAHVVTPEMKADIFHFFQNSLRRPHP